MIPAVTTPSIAVVIPNRNDAKYLSVCLDSILSQSVRPDQIVFVDDASTDNSLAIVEEKLMHEKDVRIIVNQACLGTMGALNEGLRHVTCDYVFFLASNDYMVNGIFERARTCIMAADMPGVWSAMVWVVDEAGRHLYMYPSPVVALNDCCISRERAVRLGSSLGGWFMGTTIAYHRETLQSLGGFDKDFQGLADLLAALTLASLRGASYSPEPLGIMRLHADGYLFRTLTNLKNLEAILDKIEARCPALSPDLFNAGFCDRTRHRFRFAAIRAFNDTSWTGFCKNWQGLRYKLLAFASPVFGFSRTLGLVAAYIILRPFDIVPTIWHRIFLVVLVGMRLKIRNRQ